MSEPSARALEVFSEHLRRLEEGQTPDLEVLCSENEALAFELRQLHEEWSRMSEVLTRLGPKEGTLSLQLKERYGDSVDPEISLSSPEEGGVADESSAALMSKLSSQGGSERYRARGEIARGGMGAIFKVWDEDLRRPLAMKVALRDDGGTTGAATDANSQKRLSRFLEEAQITSQLDHPGIVPVHDLGIDAEGRVYFTMQLVDGRDMRDIVALAQRGEEGWDLRRVVGVLIRVCEALAYAHSKGVVHRDIKPGNVMVGKFGEVFLMDWGLAKVMGREDEIDAATSTIIHTLRSDGSSAEHTIAGDVVGTPSFMAPEQALGRGSEVGPASDLYAVGAMLYLMLTGQVPYQPLGESVSALTILEAVKTGPPWPIHKINPDAPPELVAICEKAMEREIPARFSDAMALGEELRNWLEGHAVATYETGVFYGLRKWVGRNKGMAAALLGMVFVVLGGLGLLFQQQQESIQDLKGEQEQTKAAQRAAEENAERAQIEAARASEEAKRADAEAQLVIEARLREEMQAKERAKLAEGNRRARYRAQIIAAWFSLRLYEADRARQRLADTDADLQGWEWGHLTLGSDDSVQAPVSHPTGSLDLVAAGEDVVSMGNDAVVRIFDSNDWSHEDLAVRYGVPVFAAQLAKGRNICALSGDGVLATAAQSGVILLWDMESLDLVGPLVGGKQMSATAHVMDLAFSADGQFLASVDSKGAARVWDVSLKSVLWETEVGGSLSSVAFDPVNQHVAFGAEDGRVEMWAYDEDGGRRLGGFVEEHGVAINALTYSHSGLLLASAGEDGEVQLWDPRALEGQGLSEGMGLNDLLGLGNFPTLNEQLQRSAQRAMEYANKSADPELTLRGHRQGATCLSFSWDDRVVYAGGKDGTIRAWNAVNGEEHGIWNGHQGEVHGIVILKGEHILSGSKDGTLRVFDPYWEGTRQGLGGEGGGAVLFVGEDSSGADALAVRGEGSVLRERPEASLGAVRSLPGSWVAGARAGEYFALTGEDEVVQVFDLTTGELVRTLEGHDADVVDIASDDMGYRVITGSSDSRAIVWEGVDPFEELESWSISHGRGVVAVAISADAKVVATADKDKAIQLWDAEERRSLDSWSAVHKWPIDAISLAHDGGQVASASREEVRVFRGGKQEPVVVLGPHQDDVTAVAFNGDGQRLATGDTKGRIYLWDMRDVEGLIQLIELSGHEAEITSLAFVEGDKTLLSGDASGIVFAWRSEPDPGRYERWKRTERTTLREQRIIRYFDGDMALTHQRLSTGVPGLTMDDPAVEHLLEILAPSAEQSEPTSGE